MNKAATILLIEGKRTSKRLSFISVLNRRYEVIVTHTGKQALEIATHSDIDIIVLNAASMRTSGQRISQGLRQQVPHLPIVQITPPHANKTSVRKVHKENDPTGGDGESDILLQHPFTPRKLFNRIERFINAKDGMVLQAGPLKMNLKSRVLLTPKGEVRLTPKLAVLIELFMRHPNQTLERKFLMEKVWQTDYLGDTRTLDVHIRWIREAIEDKPSKPAILRTIRGKGYVLDLSGDQRKPGKGSG